MGSHLYPRFDGTQACADPPREAAAAFAAVPGADPEPAKALCAGCAFLDACRAYALEQDVHGVWGGLTEEERRARRDQEGRPAPTSIGDELDRMVLAWRGDPAVRRAA